jgi:hypothetical protein
MVEAILRSAIREPSTETSGVSYTIHATSELTSQPVRTAALRCLAIFPDVIRFEALQKEKSRVIRELGNALDDPVRAVRKEAVECRAKWYVPAVHQCSVVTDLSGIDTAVVQHLFSSRCRIHCGSSNPLVLRQMRQINNAPISNFTGLIALRAREY